MMLDMCVIVLCFNKFYLGVAPAPFRGCVQEGWSADSEKFLQSWVAASTFIFMSWEVRVPLTMDRAYRQLPQLIQKSYDIHQ